MSRQFIPNAVKRQIQQFSDAPSRDINVTALFSPSIMVQSVAGVGELGPTGFTGPTGISETGSTGAIGGLGRTGPTGFTGNSLTGFTGPTGQSFTGPHGPTGVGATGPTGNMTIRSITITTPTGTIVFGSIPQTYRHLKVLGNARSTVVALTDNLQMAFVVLNSLFGWTSVTANNASLTTDQTAFQVSPTIVAIVGGATSDTNYIGSIVIDIPSYTAPPNQNFARGCIGTSTVNSATSANNFSRVTVGTEVNNDLTSITNITFTLSSGSNFATNSQFILQAY